jgi:phage tail-like protein
MPRVDPHRAFRFQLEIGGLNEGGFQTVSGLERETEIESFREGGVNTFEYKLVTRTHYPPLKLKRGLASRTLWDWHQQVIDGRVVRQIINIVLFDDAGAEAWRWVCIGAYPAKWTGADLDATANQVAAETVEFVHHGLTRT